MPSPQKNEERQRESCSARPCGGDRGTTFPEPSLPRTRWPKLSGSHRRMLHSRGRRAAK